MLKRNAMNLNLKLTFKKDTLGLKTLDTTGRLHKLSCKGDHLRFTEQWFIDNIITPYLN